MSGSERTGECIVTKLTTHNSLKKLYHEWESLLERSDADTIFLTPEWVISWLEAYGGQDKLCALRVDENGRLIGLALFSFAAVKGSEAKGRRQLKFIGDGTNESEHLDIICERKKEEKVINSVLDACLKLKDQWDLLVLNEVSVNSPGVEPLKRWAKHHRWYIDYTTLPSLYIPLPNTWETYLGTLKPRMRTKVRSSLRGDKVAGSIVFDWCQSEEDLYQRLDSLYCLHASRWRMKGQHGVFGDIRRRLFYQKIGSRFLRRGWLRFFSLRIDGRFVAHEFCLERKDTISLLQEGFDADCTSIGVGNMLRSFVLHDAIKRGVKNYDFLGGASAHKLSWGSRPSDNFAIVIAPRSPSSFIYFSRRHFINHTQYIRQILMR